jgi:hypothetical protein
MVSTAQSISGTASQPEAIGAQADSRRSEEFHLKEMHNLRKVAAWVPSLAITQAAMERGRSAAAERMARMRQRKCEAGIVAVEMPVRFAEVIKSAGGPEQWVAAVKESARAEVSRAALMASIHTRCESPRPPTEPSEALPAEDRIALALGRRVGQLLGWRAWLVNWLLR